MLKILAKVRGTGFPGSGVSGGKALSKGRTGSTVSTEAFKRSRGWLWLGLFWAAVLLAGGGGIARLAMLGPPEPVLVASEPMARAEDPAAPAANPIPLAIPLAIPAPALPRHVEPGLVQFTAAGPLPRIGANGRMPSRAYARAFDGQDTRPRVALILGGFGLRDGISEEAIRTLPPQIALAFTPYAPQAGALIERARDRGFETLLALPMEPTGFPMNDPGERALLTGLSAGENAGRLEWLLARFPGHIGAVGALMGMRGQRFAALSEPFAQMQLALAARGLLYFDARPGSPPPERAWGLTVNVVVDEPHTRGEIDDRLAFLERLAQQRGGALGYVGEVTPVSMQRIASWAAGLEARGTVLAPVTALIRRPEIAAR